MANEGGWDRGRGTVSRDWIVKGREGQNGESGKAVRDEKLEVEQNWRGKCCERLRECWREVWNGTGDFLSH